MVPQQHVIQIDRDDDGVRVAAQMPNSPDHIGKLSAPCSGTKNSHAVSIWGTEQLDGIRSFVGRTIIDSDRAPVFPALRPQ